MCYGWCVARVLQMNTLVLPAACWDSVPGAMGTLEISGEQLVCKYMTAA